MATHVRRDHGRRRRDPAAPAQPTRAPEAVPAAARRPRPCSVDRRRRARRPDDITVVTDRSLRAARPRPAARRPGPARADGPQHRRGDRPGHAWPSTGPTTRSCSSSRPMPTSTRRGKTSTATSWRAAAERPRDGRVRHRGARSSRWAPRSTRPATEYGYLVPRLERGERRRRARGLPAARRSRRSPSRPVPTSWSEQAGRRLERRHLPVAAAARSARRSSATPACVQLARPDRSARRAARARLRAASSRVSIDHAVMEGAARDRPGRDGARWTSAGPTSARGPRCSRRSAARGDGRRSSSRARPSRSTPTTCRPPASTAGSASSRPPSAVA